jgi:hypothetical protein
MTLRNSPAAFLLTAIKIREPLALGVRNLTQTWIIGVICGTFVKTQIMQVSWDVKPRC